MDVVTSIFGIYGLCTFLALLCSVFVYYRWGYKPYQYFKKQGVPGPQPKPFVGNLLMLRQFKGDFVSIMSHVTKTYGPTSGFFFAIRPCLFTSDLDTIREVMIKQFDKFVNRRVGGIQIFVDGKGYDNIASIKGDEWRKRRHFVSPAFSGRKMRLMEPLIKDSLTRLVNKLSNSPENSMESLDAYSKCIMEVILSTAFGRSIDVQGGKGGELYEAALGVFTEATGQKSSNVLAMLRILLISFYRISPLVSPLMRKLTFFKHIDRVTDAAVQLINVRRKEQDSATRKDLLQILIDAVDEETKGGLSTGEIVADSVGFLLAGYGTTSVTLTFATYLLATHPEVQEKLANEIHDYLEEHPESSLYDAAHELNYLDMVVCETLRLYPPAPLTFRLCNEDCTINGVYIKSGLQVAILIRTVHYNPEIYPDPESFIPERFSPEEKAKRHPCAYLPFGLGPRNCVGMRFALLQAKLTLFEVVRNFKIELSPKTKVPLELDQGFRPKHDVHIIYHPRN